MICLFFALFSMSFVCNSSKNVIIAVIIICFALSVCICNKACRIRLLKCRSNGVAALLIILQLFPSCAQGLPCQVAHTSLNSSTLMLLLSPNSLCSATLMPRIILTQITCHWDGFTVRVTPRNLMPFTLTPYLHHMLLSNIILSVTISEHPLRTPTAFHPIQVLFFLLWSLYISLSFITVKHVT